MKARFEFDTEEEYKEYLRTYFAARAMQGMLSNPKLVEILEASNLHPDDHCQFMTEDVIEHADELLKQLNKPSK